MTTTSTPASTRLRSLFVSFAVVLGTIATTMVPLSTIEADEAPSINATLGFVSPPSIGEPAELVLTVWATTPVSLLTQLSLTDGIQIVEGAVTERGSVESEGIWQQSITLVILSEAELDIGAVIEALTADGERLQKETHLSVAAAPSMAGVDHPRVRVTDWFTASQPENVTRASDLYIQPNEAEEDPGPSSLGSVEDGAGQKPSRASEHLPYLPERGSEVGPEMVIQRDQGNTNHREGARRPDVSAQDTAPLEHRSLVPESSKSILTGANQTSAPPTIRDMTGATTSIRQPASVPESDEKAAIGVDLIVTDIWSTTNPLQAGEAENITFTIKNQGDTSTATTFYIRLRVDGTVLGTWVAGGLSAGQTAQAGKTVTIDSPGTHQVQVEVDYTGAVYEANEGNNIRTEYWGWAAPDRDLIVEDIWSTTNPLQAGEVENITFRIKNQGTVSTTTKFYTRLKVDGSVVASWYTNSLAAGATTTGSTNVTIGTVGTHQVQVEVDYTGVVVEANEGNNVRTENWSWGAPDRDLIVQDIWSATTPLQAGEVENITFRIKNEGSMSTAVTFYTRLKINGSVVASWSTPGLAAGATTTGSTNVTVGTAGTHQVQVEVDYTGLVVEANEGNNVRTESWGWAASACDLIVEDIWSTTNPLQAGDVENITFRIKNQGGTSTATTFYTRLKVDGSVVGSWYTPGLAAGATASASTNVTLGAAGSHQIQVEVDYTGVVVEGNEGNNARTENWSWATAPDCDLIVQDIWSTTNPLHAGEVENITFRIKNQGSTSAATTFYSRIWVDGVVAGTWSTPGLAAGATATGSMSLTVSTGGTHEIRAEVDYTSVVGETDEGNNVRTENWGFVAAAIFADGFESGNTSAWSGTVP